jgi:hypothetical protein
LIVKLRAIRLFRFSRQLDWARENGFGFAGRDLPKPEKFG